MLGVFENFLMAVCFSRVNVNTQKSCLWEGVVLMAVYIYLKASDLARTSKEKHQVDFSLS